MIRCPETLKIGPHIYCIGIEPSDDELPYASIHLVTNEIVFAHPSISPTQALVSLVHEFIHGSEEVSSIHDSNSRLAHDQIRWVSNVVVDLLQQLGLDSELEIAHLPLRQIARRSENGARILA